MIGKPFKIFYRTANIFNIVPKQSQGGIAFTAKESPDHSCFMAMVYAQPTAARLGAYRASSALGIEEIGVFSG